MVDMEVLAETMAKYRYLAVPELCLVKGINDSLKATDIMTLEE